MIVGILLFYVAFKLDDGALSSICTAVMGMVGLLMVHETSKPYNKIRTAMMIFVCVGFGRDVLADQQQRPRRGRDDWQGRRRVSAADGLPG